MKSEIDFVFDRLAEEIKVLRTAKSDSLYEIGRILLDAKAKLAHGQWLDFLRDSRVGLLPRFAQMLMRVSAAENGKELAAYGISKAIVLLMLPVAERRQLLQQNRIDLLTVSELRALVRQIMGTTQRAASGGQRGVPSSRPSEGNEIAWAAGVLHLPVDRVTDTSLEQSFRELAQVFHPDHARTVDEKFMRNILAAREVLRKHLGKEATVALGNNSHT
jgi:Protein of unknown function (DUF3102)